MSNVTSTQVSNRKVLEKTTAFETAVAWAQKGEVDRGAFVAWCCENVLDLGAAAPLLMATFTGEQGAKDFAAVMAAQTRLLVAMGQKSAGSGGQIRPGVSQKGGVSLYGINSRMPVTLYADQWERLLKWLNAPADNPLSTFINSKPTKEHEIDGVKRVVGLSRKGE